MEKQQKRIFEWFGDPSKEIPPLYREEGFAASGAWYRRYHDQSNEWFYPSITTVLSKTDPPEKQQSLKRWKERVGAKEAKKITERSQRVGTTAHLLLESYIKEETGDQFAIVATDIYKNPSLNDDDRKPAVQHFQSIRSVLDNTDLVQRIYQLEIPMYSKVLELAGTADCIAEYQNQISIVDFKTSLKPKKEEWIENYFLQAAAYAFMLQELTKRLAKQLVVIISVENKPSPQVFVKTGSQLNELWIELVKRRKMFLESIEKDNLTEDHYQQSLNKYDRFIDYLDK